MFRRSLLSLLSLALVVAVQIPLPAHAIAPVETKEKGLYISPLRNYLSLNAGDSVTRAFTVANLTNQPMVVSSHIQRFSVTDYAYDYKFNETGNDWVKIIETTVSLKPYESRELAYTVTLPKSAAPGGHYYTLFASATVKSGDTTTTVQAATLLYLTINGALVRTSQITPKNLPTIVTGPSINYSIDLKNTGNTHYFALVSSRVDGLFYSNAPNGTSQLLMPGTVRTATASINSPLLPGIYKLTYTVAPDQGKSTTGSRYFLYAPLWSIVILIFVILGIVKVVKRRASRGSQHPPSNS